MRVGYSSWVCHLRARTLYAKLKCPRIRTLYIDNLRNQLNHTAGFIYRQIECGYKVGQEISIACLTAIFHGDESHICGRYDRMHMVSPDSMHADSVCISYKSSNCVSHSIGDTGSTCANMQGQLNLRSALIIRICRALNGWTCEFGINPRSSTSATYSVSQHRRIYPACLRYIFLRI